MATDGGGGGGGELEAAWAALEEAGARQRRIDELKAQSQAVLEARDALPPTLAAAVGVPAPSFMVALRCACGRATERAPASMLSIAALHLSSAPDMALALSTASLIHHPCVGRERSNGSDSAAATARTSSRMSQARLYD